MIKVSKKQIFDFAKSIWSYNRSLTGEGVNKTLNKIKSQCKSLKIIKIKSNSKVFDWKIPLVWKVKDAFILDPEGNKICDFKENNLHLMGYSDKKKGYISLKNLKKKLHSNPSQPKAIPYVTSYYKKNWGMCIDHNSKKKLKEGRYFVSINTSFKKGNLNIGEIKIRGKYKKEILLSTYICHPSMANNEISGISVLTFIAKFLLSKKNKFSYRLLFMPETIGSIAYIQREIKTLKKNIIAGYIITCIGDERNYSYLKTKTGNSISDKIAISTLKNINKKYKIYDWLKRGSDERQFNSPGVDLPIGSLMKSKYGTFPEYHTSLDKLGSVVTPKGLYDGFNLVKKVIQSFENKIYPKSVYKCEPNLGKRNLYHTISKKSGKIGVNIKNEHMNYLNFLSWSDGKNSLEDISVKTNISLEKTKSIYKILTRKGLVTDVD